MYRGSYAPSSDSGYTVVPLLVYGEKNSFGSVLYIPPRSLEAVGLKPSTPGEITWPFCPRLPPKHVAIKENVPFMILSQLRVKPAQAVRGGRGRANKSPAEQTAGLPSPGLVGLRLGCQAVEGQSTPAEH